MKRFIHFIIAFAFVLLATASLYLGFHPRPALIDPGYVRGSAVLVKGTTYTLNYNQQSELLRLINRGRPLASPPPKDEGVVEAVLIYRFEGAPIVLTPLGSRYFKVDRAGETLYIEVREPKALSTFLETTYNR